jgi:hypothetical protein
MSRPATTGDLMIVACKLPGGLILRWFDTVDSMEPQRDGTSKPIRISQEDPEKRWIVRGTMVASAGQAFVNPLAASELLPGGYALTHGVPKEVWDHWLETNRHTNLVRNKVVFAYPDMSTAQEVSVEHKAVKSGLEPIDRNNPGEKMGRIDRRLKLGILEDGGNMNPETR